MSGRSVSARALGFFFLTLLGSCPALAETKVEHDEFKHATIVSGHRKLTATTNAPGVSNLTVHLYFLAIVNDGQKEFAPMHTASIQILYMADGWRLASDSPQLIVKDVGQYNGRRSDATVVSCYHDTGCLYSVSYIFDNLPESDLPKWDGVAARLYLVGNLDTTLQGANEFLSAFNRVKDEQIAAASQPPKTPSESPSESTPHAAPATEKSAQP